MKKNKGFTLIELLVVIAIIGILAAIVLVSLRGARGKAMDARIKAEVSQVPSLAEMYYSDNDYSFKDFCTSTDLDDIKADIQKISGQAATCYDSEDAFCFSAYLPDAKKWFCVDSDGRKVSDTSNLCDSSNCDCQ